MRIERAKQYFAAAFMAGFIGGILFANLTVKDYVTTSGIFNPYFLKQYAQSEIEAGEYILLLVWYPPYPAASDRVFGTDQGQKDCHRCSICLGRVFGRNNCVCGDSEYGNSGYCVLDDCDGAAVSFFYALAYLIVLWHFFIFPQARWNMGKTFAVLVFMTAGLITEAYVNPILMQMFLDTL